MGLIFIEGISFNDCYAYAFFIRSLINQNSFVTNLYHAHYKILYVYRFNICCIAVERGLIEVRKLGIEQQLWEASRREIGQPSVANGKHTPDSEA